MHHQNGQARSDSWNRLIERQVADAEPDTAAQEKHRKSAATEAVSKRVRPGRQQNRGNAQAIKVGHRAPEHTRRATGEDDRKREQHGRQKSGEHGQVPHGARRFMESEHLQNSDVNRSHEPNRPRGRPRPRNQIGRPRTSSRTTTRTKGRFMGGENAERPFVCQLQSRTGFRPVFVHRRSGGRLASRRAGHPARRNKLLKSYGYLRIAEKPGRSIRGARCHPLRQPTR